MTTTKSIERISGAIEAVNDKGIKVNGTWLNFSTYHPISVGPSPGELVELEIEHSSRGGAWIRQLTLVDELVSPKSIPLPVDKVARQSVSSVDVRLKCIEIAGHVVGYLGQAREDVKSEHIFPLATKILAWV